MSFRKKSVLNCKIRNRFLAQLFSQDVFRFLWTLALSFLPLFYIHFYFGKSFWSEYCGKNSDFLVPCQWNDVTIVIVYPFEIRAVFMFHIFNFLMSSSLKLNTWSSLVVWWLELRAFTAVTWVQSLVGELRSLRPRDAAKCIYI